jgi:hypothetical protein
VRCEKRLKFHVVFVLGEVGIHVLEVVEATQYEPRLCPTVRWQSLFVLNEYFQYLIRVAPSKLQHTSVEAIDSSLTELSHRNLLNYVLRVAHTMIFAGSSLV